ncbi:MAG: DegT/DnrJ/EryC1/StrS family aminotransferase [Firmicutes bacterium]|nr:DegT/DnrJ/EryC1/StrS family aminotransferase [Bacillota bacterium]
MRQRIYLSSPHMSGLEMDYVDEAFKTNWVAPLGPHVTAFENEMCIFTGRKYAAALSSGTAAIHLGLKALGVGKGDIVFCPSFTFAGSANPIDYLGAIPVFIDSDPDTFNMSPSALEAAYKEYPNPKAVIIVNLYGNPADFGALLCITKRYGTPVLEDAAESLGAEYQGKQTGSFGDISILSFNGNKIITTSGGGMALTDSQKWRDKIVFWATQSREKAAWYQHEEIGYNYRLSNILAGIGRGQLKVLEARVKRKTEIFELYAREFADNPHIRMCPQTAGGKSNRWLTVITLSGECKAGVMDVIGALEKENIEARPVWKPMHLQPVFKNCPFFSALSATGVCASLFERGVCLPSDTKMSDGEVRLVAAIVNSVVGTC